MFRDIETRDSYETRADRAQAAEYAANRELPDWLRNAWQAVAEGRARSVEEALEKRVKPGTVPQARASSSARSQSLNAGKWEMLAGKMHPKVDTEIDDETRGMIAKRRKLAAMRWA